MLSIVSTPIGNLEDITFRAVRTLKEADLIAAEDTRTASILLSRYSIQKPLLSFHAHSHESRCREIVDRLQKGQHIALITDAGTPGISDPGWTLIHHALTAGMTVVPIPGPSAFLTALVGSGLPMDKFLYLGFLPLKKGRKKLLLELSTEKRTLVIYESPHRILRTLEEMKALFPKETQVVVARELTKIHEEFLRGDFETVLKALKARPSIKGEFVLLLKNP
jgi:16S rRNA (cytidine1402-2'-O)-methyltransferase